VLQVLKVQPVLKVLLAHKVHRVQLVLKVLLVHKVLQVLKEQ
jgi:hypothetical protein